MANCSAPYENADVTGIYCELPEGHGGLHLAMRPIEWAQDEPTIGDIAAGARAAYIPAGRSPVIAMTFEPGPEVP